MLGISLAALLAVSAAASPPGHDPTDNSWDLNASFPTAEAWDQAVTDLDGAITRFHVRETSPVESATTLASLLDEARGLRGRAGRLARFALLTHVLDTSNDVAQARFGVATALESRVEGAVAWLDAAIVGLGSVRIRGWQRTDPRLARHGWRLSRLFSTLDHRWPTGTAEAYAALGRTSTGVSDIYDALMSADLGWPSIRNKDGSDSVVSPASFGDFARSENTALRRSAIDAYCAHLRALESPLGALLVRKLETDSVLARARSYENSFDAFFGVGDGLPPGAWSSLVVVAQASVPLLTRYARTQARLQGLDKIRYSELGLPPPIKVRTIPLDEAKSLAIAAAAPFGAEYQRGVDDHFRQPWFDLLPGPHKDGGAVGVYWQVGGGHPYGVMSYRGAFRDPQTLAAISALMMFYARIPPGKLPERREDDFPVYGNAVWWSGGLMEVDAQMARTTNRDERIVLLAGDLRRLWDAFFAGAIDVDFENRVETAIREHHAPTGAELSRMYLETLRRYYSQPDGAMVTDDDGTEWMTLSNEFYGHVFAEWSFAIAGAAAIAERSYAGDREVLDSIAWPMSRAGSFTSYDLMRDIGADPTKISSYQPLMRRIRRDLDALDQELASTPPADAAAH